MLFRLNFFLLILDYLTLFEYLIHRRAAAYPHIAAMPLRTAQPGWLHNGGEGASVYEGKGGGAHLLADGGH